MKKIFLVMAIAIPVVSACSKLPGFSDCDEAVSNNLLQETVEQNLFRPTPSAPFYKSGNFFCEDYAKFKDSKNHYCDIKLEVSDVKEVAKNSFTSSCKANVRYSATLRMADYQKARQEEVSAINAKASADIAQAKDHTIQIFERFGVKYSEADLKEGIAKREAAVRAAQEEALKKVRPEKPKQQSYFVVVSTDYTVTVSKDMVNLNLDDMTQIAEGE